MCTDDGRHTHGQTDTQADIHKVLPTLSLGLLSGLRHLQAEWVVPFALAVLQRSELSSAAESQQIQTA